MIDLERIFGYDEDVAVAVADLAIADPVEIEVVGRLEYSGEIANEDDLHGAAGVFDEVVDTTDPWPPGEDTWPDPCLECGGMELWENPLGDWRCMECDPPTRAIRLLERTQRLRKRYGLPDPLGTA